MSVEADALFDEANLLWFNEGATARALDRYESAAGAAPDDPVIAYQLARALWALGRTDQAASALAVAEASSDRLTSLGRTLLARARTQLATSPADTLPVDAASFDVDVLERLDLPVERWLDVALAARQREMYGLAAHAFARGSSFHVAELDEEEHTMRKEASSVLNMLEVMRAEPRPARPSREPTVGAPSAIALPSPAPEVEAAHGVPRRPSRLDGAPAFEIRVEPAVSGVEDDVVLEVAFRNAEALPLAVNGRLLLNNPGAPSGYGELALSVEGPPEYGNATVFTVRSGSAAPEDFIVLAPGEEIRRSYVLSDYESLHLPGRYRIWVTYRNEVAATVGGVHAWVGAVASNAVSIERRAG